MSGFDPATIIDALATTGHNGLIGTRYIAHGADWVELAIDPDPRLAMDDESGVPASGPIMALMDIAATLAIWVAKGKPRGVATLDLRVDHLRPTRPGRTITGRVECYRMTRDVAFLRGQAHDGDPADPVVHTASTFMFLPSRRPA